MARTETDSPLQQQIESVIRDFPFDDYGLDDLSCLLEDDPDAQEWVSALARKVLAVIGEEATS